MSNEELEHVDQVSQQSRWTPRCSRRYTQSSAQFWIGRNQNFHSQVTNCG